ncbi:FtsX-like permease family protein [Reyranella sp. CPCC 100927]|uniref:FtsX-like permease family protein n=1 Tax=Reyranella sp. CPCC 100927 TaxID=2599616 RepID=UPI0011B61E7D|nr:FtsX-like permease family protein [Reyranella sp. CPCC 100927]TWT09578.1 FtsX-like permease family protein [Reyranella sp. CPCC 100927]
MAFSAVERLISLRYLRARREEGFISIIAWFSLVGIALGVGTLIVVMAVMNGFRVELLNQITAVNGQLGVTSGRGPISDYQPLLDKIRMIPGVASANPVVEGQAVVVSTDGVRGVMIRGMRLEDLEARAPIARSLLPSAATARRDASRSDVCAPRDKPPTVIGDRGRLQDLADDGNVIVGIQLAEILDVKVGSEIDIVSPRTIDTPVGRVPRKIRVRVAAVFEVGMYDYDSNFIYMPMEKAQDFFDQPGQASLIEVFAADPGNYQRLAPRISEAVEWKAYAFDWIEANAGFFNTVQVQTNVMFLVLTLIIVVAAFNIVSSLMMLVRTKGPDIAILRTMGASRGQILRIFLVDGMGIGLVGVGLGVGLGLLFVRNIEALRQAIQSTFRVCLFDPQLYLLSELPARISSGEVILIAVMALVFAFLATLYPAWTATRLDPLEGLRRG